ncbi:glycopeptide antibiotics resistance protein [Microbacterium sp. SORGH_AS428]|uniref:VanZ family protein n=1 Tax=Microbacterium sp. SORGH_AS_0428 TaxID=3041788 RepID=UPI002862A49F|nr:VanZ family protein [Microbacterium sp. SORGH_AS_0428]MDR6201033.1 glycopeptide antibiotics resistance protein [Microbacterium sp. SORGH_AS_0428]
MTHAAARGRRSMLLLAVATAAYLVVLARLTLVADDAAGTGGILKAWAEAFRATPWTRWITFDLLEFGANIALFVPAGLLGALWLGRRWWLAVPVGLAISAVIETTQGLLLAGRVADVRDLVSNTTGTVIGALAIAATRRIRRR